MTTSASRLPSRPGFHHSPQMRSGPSARRMQSPLPSPATSWSAPFVSPPKGGRASTRPPRRAAWASGTVHAAPARRCFCAGGPAPGIVRRAPCRASRRRIRPNFNVPVELLKKAKRTLRSNSELAVERVRRTRRRRACCPPCAGLGPARRPSTRQALARPRRAWRDRPPLEPSPSHRGRRGRPSPRGAPPSARPRGSRARPRAARDRSCAKAGRAPRNSGRPASPVASSSWRRVESCRPRTRGGSLRSRLPVGLKRGVQGSACCECSGPGSGEPKPAPSPSRVGPSRRHQPDLCRRARLLRLRRGHRSGRPASQGTRCEGRRPPASSGGRSMRVRPARGHRRRRSDRRGG